MTGKDQDERPEVPDSLGKLPPGVRNELLDFLKGPFFPHCPAE